jgi:CRISPR-associated endonuclease/helicase Cas3
VATSLVEAGVDLSFRSAFRERFSAASLIQIGGRANRHGLHSEPGSVVDFLLAADADLTAHPAAARPSAVLGDLFQAGAFSGVFSAGDLVTRALRAELRREHGSTGSELADAEAALNYPAAAEAGRLIANDTELVIVRCEIADRIRNGERISSRDLLSGSVQLWRSRIAAFDLSPIGSRAGIFEWPRAYDGKFLGYMAGVISSGQRDQFII